MECQLQKPETLTFINPELCKDLRWTPPTVIVTIRDNRDYSRVLLYSYYTTITGWGALLTKTYHASYLSSFGQMRLIAVDDAMRP